METGQIQESSGNFLKTRWPLTLSGLDAKEMSILIRVLDKLITHISPHVNIIPVYSRGGI